eukprot:Pgem_evm1s16730
MEYIMQLVLNQEKKERSISEVHSKLNSCVLVDPTTNKVLGKGTDSPFHPLNHAAMVAIGDVAKYQLALCKNQSSQKNVDGDPYLCTGLDAYFSKEPCVM